ncbi:MAG: twin-arginine translocation signal domain-containing protein [Pseudomonadota bacterium]
MDRRSFLKSIGAAGLLPALPFPSLAVASTAVTPVVSTHTYQWAEMIVRAHNKCNLGMLQRLLQIDNATASVLKRQLLENGIISANANAYGMHTAVKPLYEGAFMNVSETSNKVIEKVSEIFEEGEIEVLPDDREVSLEEEEPTESDCDEQENTDVSSRTLAENQS